MDILKEYLIHCYLYYALDECVIIDAEFDDLCRRINQSWDTIESPYKQLLLDNGEVKGLIKGLSLLADQYPEEIKETAQQKLLDYQDLKEILEGYE